jgi:hypothetical protein
MRGPLSAWSCSLELHVVTVSWYSELLLSEHEASRGQQKYMHEVSPDDVHAMCNIQFRMGFNGSSSRCLIFTLLPCPTLPEISIHLCRMCQLYTVRCNVSTSGTKVMQSGVWQLLTAAE